MAVQRIPAHQLMYFDTGMKRGKGCGKIQTLFLSVSSIVLCNQRMRFLSIFVHNQAMILSVFECKYTDCHLQCLFMCKNTLKVTCKNKILK